MIASAHESSATGWPSHWLTTDESGAAVEATEEAADADALVRTVEEYFNATRRALF
jgi:hypothetical protein